MRTVPGSTFILILYLDDAFDSVDHKMLLGKPEDCVGLMVCQNRKGIKFFTFPRLPIKSMQRG